jgi:hypothetical protein
MATLTGVGRGEGDGRAEAEAEAEGDEDGEGETVPSGGLNMAGGGPPAQPERSASDITSQSGSQRLHDDRCTASA